MPKAKAGEVELSYERSGSGEPLLLIMGMSGTYLHWDEVMLGELRERFEVIVYDHRGVGESARVSQPFTISELAQDAIGLLEALGVGEAHVLGFSMGGMVAQELVLSRPELVRTLTLASTYCGGPGSRPAGSETVGKLTSAMASGDREAALRAAWEVNVSERMAQDDAAYARFAGIAERRRVAVAVVMEQMRAIVAHDTSGRLPAVRKPTLVIHGTADAMVPVSNGEMIAGLIEGSRLELLEGAAHMFFWEEPERAATLIAEHALGARAR
ncbi:MAG: alpha/beta fold hydrolase [Acidobacteriota bacterium]|nr:alpha/beta fold hydrolase [Acidobacteriota bacterium]